MQINGAALDSKALFAFSMGSLTPAATGAATTAEQDFDVPAGTPALQTTDLCFVSPPASGNAVACVGARVKDSNTISVKFANPTAGSLTHGAGEFKILIVRV